MSIAPGRTTTIAWAFERDAQPLRTDAPRSGWWVMALGPSGDTAACSTAIVRSTATAVTARDDKPEARRRISLGVVRPAQIVAFVARGDDARSGPLSLLRAIDSAEWDAWIEGDTIRVQSEVRFAPALGR